MKKLLLFLSGCIIAGLTPLHAQVTTGSITYDQVMHMNIDLGEEAAQFRDMFPKETHMTYVLSFDEKAAVYRADKSKPVVPRGGAAPSEEIQIDFQVQVPEDILYTDLQTGRVVQQKDLMDRKFLLNDEPEKMTWRMTGRQKEVLEYSCQEAVCVKGKDTISAWFTTLIPVSAGPMDWHGLPGMILEGAIGSGGVSMTITATRVDAVRPEVVALAAPKEGKKVTRKEFEAIAEKKQKEMEAEYGGHGNVIIHID